MIKYIAKFLYILPTNALNLFWLLLLFLISPFLDTIGIGGIGAFTGLATNPKSIRQNDWLLGIYNQLNLNNVQEFICLLGLGILLIFYIKSALSFWIQGETFRFSYSQQRKLRLRLMSIYLAAPYTFHLKTNTALLIQNIFNETNQFSNNIIIPFLRTISEFLVLCCLVLLLAKTNITATLTVSALLLIAFLIYNLFRAKQAYLGKESSQAQAQAIRILNHALGGFKEMRVIGCEEYFETQMDEEAKRFTESRSSYQVLRLIPRILIEVFLVTFLIGFTGVFVLLSKESQNLTSTLSIFAVASLRLMPSVSQFMASIGTLQNSSYTLDKLYFDVKEIEQLESSISLNLPQPPRDSSLPKVMPFSNQIILDQVTYRYPDSPEPALQNISLVLNKGQSIAFIGKSGAGKTTLVDVILGLLTPESGDIRVDEQSIYKNLRSWQNLVGYIPQSIFLIDDTLERNIAFGVPDALIDLERLNKSIAAAQLLELVDQLPDGIKTTVGERGVRLSGGQRQRVGIARALYHQREILVMDEATAALDAETESLVTESIKSLSGTKTIMIIAHRLSTIKHCDCIYLIEQGRIVNSGSYQEVVGETETLS